jgi:hypothetical protein
MVSESKVRVVALVIYAAILAAIQVFIVDTRLVPNENSIWLYNGIASLLFGSRLLNPHFTPPADAATNSFIALASIVAASLVVPPSTYDAILLWVVAAFCGLICVCSILVLLVRAPIGLETRAWVKLIDRAVRNLGNPNVIFTIVILVAVWLFHRTRPHEVFAIISAWTIITFLKPIEGLLALISLANAQTPPFSSDRLVGSIAAHQSPGIVLIRQSTDIEVARGTPLLVADDRGPWMLGVALNYVGRDEGNLLRVLTASVPPQLAHHVSELDGPVGSGVALTIEAAPEDLAEVQAIQWINRLCGIVDSETSLEFMYFEVIEDHDLSEGRLVEARIGEHRRVMFQVIEGVTREEIVQQKNKYGYARAKARKIGRWDDADNKFKPVRWLPQINAPVFLINSAEHVLIAATVGHFPGTPYSVGLNISSAVTHNTAILGILGIGKSFLAIEMVERMIAEGIKVICLDLTNQYAQQLERFFDKKYEEAQLKELLSAGGRGEIKQSKEEGGSAPEFREAVIGQFRDFIDPNNKRLLRVYSPASFDVWRQTGFKDYKSGDAAMASLTPSEITAIMSDAALTVCQELGMTDSARLCLVYEEAHTLVPEWNSVAADGDKAATAQTARAILQGRKYGLGCLLVTQRTANVTKTILNQCNTIFAMRTFDDTGKDFLSNYIGGDYASVLPSLEERHAVLFGKASSCENPVLLRLNDRDKFLEVFRAAHPPAELPSYEADDDGIPEIAELLGAAVVKTDKDEPPPGPRIRRL